MERIQLVFQEIKQSVKQGIRDHSQVTQIRGIVDQIKLDSQTVRIYCNVLFKLYDFSNSSHFITCPPHLKNQEQIDLDPLAISIKALVLRMFSKLVAFFNDNPGMDLPHSLLNQSLEIMIMVSRVLLDLQKSSQVRPIYGRVVAFREAMQDVLPAESQLCHWINVIQLLSLDVDGCKIDIFQYKQALQKIIKFSKALNNLGSQYLQLSQSLTLQTILKLLKKGNQQSKSLIKYLLPKQRQLIQQLTSQPEQNITEQTSSIKVSPFYELYLQIKQNGITNIAEQNLRLFIAKQQHFNDIRIFDVVALTRQLMPLEIWFQIYLNFKGKCQLLVQAFKCFVYVVDVELQDIAEKQHQLGVQEGYHLKGQVIDRLMKLARVVMVCMLSQKKDSIEPIVNLVKRLSKLLIHTIMILNPKIEVVEQYTQKLLMICNKYGLAQPSRSINYIFFYYQLIMDTVTQESYNKVSKINLLDKGSELFKCLKMAYLFRIGKQLDVSQERDFMINQPFIGLLFARQNQEQLILKIKPQEIAKMVQKWEIYLLLLKENKQNCVLENILSHLQQTLICTEWQLISKRQLQDIEVIQSNLLNRLNEQEQDMSSGLKLQISIVLLYLVHLRMCHSKLSQIHEAVLFNRFSKLVKLLSLAQQTKVDEESMELKKIGAFVSKKYLFYQHQCLKVQYLSQQISNWAGLLVIVDFLHGMLQKSGLSQQEAQFFKFIRFEILCLTDSATEGEYLHQKNGKLLKLYCSSKYIKKQVKLKIMRKLIRQDLIAESRLITLAEMGELIVLADDKNEKKIFASYILRSFGEEGRTYLMLRSEREPEAFGFLIELQDDQ